jgi:DNA primase
LFSKGSELYGLFEARLAIRELGYVLVVEGYMDVVALAQLGFANAVATLGTACTPIHVQKLFRQTDTVVFSFDGDSAGRRAARRALEAALPHAADNRTIKFLFLPKEHDPDSYVREFGTDGFGEQVDRAMPLSQFLLNEVLNDKQLDQPEGRAKALFDAKPLLQALPANALRVQILHMLSDRLATPFAEIAALCDIDSRAAAVARASVPKSERRRVTGQEQRALRNLVMYPGIAVSLDQESERTLVTMTEHAELFSEVIGHARELGGAAEFQLLSEVLRNAANAPTYNDIFQEILAYDENVRDLLMRDPSDEDAAQRVEDQKRLLAEELQATVVKLRHDSYRARLDQLARQATLSPEEVAEFSELSARVAQIKAGRVASPDVSR